MKKNYTCAALLLFVSAICFAQSNTTGQSGGVSQPNTPPQTKSFGGGKFNIGVDGGLVEGTYNNTYNSVLGFSIKYEIPVAKNVYGTLSAGYATVSTKSDSVSATGYKSSYGFFPDKIGLKYCYKGHVFAELQAGILLPAESGNTSSNLQEPIVETTFIYSFGIGYTMPKGVELGLRYESWDEGYAFNQWALRLAYRF